MNSLHEPRLQTDMKQKLLSILSEKNKKNFGPHRPTQSMEANISNSSRIVQVKKKTNPAPVEMNNFQRKQWLFNVISVTSSQAQQLQDAYLKLSKLICYYKKKEKKWDQKRQALKDEIKLLKQLLLQDASQNFKD